MERKFKQGDRVRILHGAFPRDREWYAIVENYSDRATFPVEVSYVETDGEINYFLFSEDELELYDWHKKGEDQ